jgi:surface protein
MAYPILAASDTWFTQGGTTITRASITEVNILDSYTPSDLTVVVGFWDASAALNGSVMVYVEGTVLTIAGDGSGKITLNADSSYLFSDHNATDYFSELIKINGAELLDTSSVTTFAHMFEYASKLTNVDVSVWDTSSCTNMSYMFNECRRIYLGGLDVFGWDVSNVTTFRAMFSYTFMQELDVRNWHTPACTNMCAMFRGVNCKILDLSNFVTDKVTDLSYMFQYDEKLTEIIGLNNFNTSSCTTFRQMFYGNMSIKTLDLSSFDTTKATRMTEVFHNLHNLERITIGEKFSLNGGNITDVAHIATFTTPNPEYISGADGNWYDVYGNAYAPSNVPDKTRAIYFSSIDLVYDKMVIKPSTLVSIANAIRNAGGYAEKYQPSEMAAAITELAAGLSVAEGVSF